MFALRRLLAGSLAAIALVLASCSHRDRLSGAEAAGKVTLDGRPVTTGTVVFVGSAGSTVAEIQSDGSYRATNVPVGPVRVLLASSGSPGPARPGQAPVPQAPPPRYRSADTSGLSLTVSEGNNPYDIAMTVR